MMMAAMAVIRGRQMKAFGWACQLFPPCPPATFLLALALSLWPSLLAAQVSYVARFSLDKPTFLMGEPIFCTFSVHNTGTQPFAFAYRNPTRIVNPELESEPRFRVVDAAGSRVADPAPRRCGGAKGTAVYGSVTLPPGQIHTERWLLNQWARFSRPGNYRVHAERRLPLLGLDPGRQGFSGPPVAFASALNDLTLEVAAATAEQLRSVFEPYERVLRKPEALGFPESVQAVITLPQAFLLDELATLASAGPEERRWDREQALEGLARLGTAEAWDVILKIALGGGRPEQVAAVESGQKFDALRASAILLLAEKGERRFLPPILALLPRAPVSLRGDILRALGFFRDQRATAVLFERLHSPARDDRVNAILGIRNLETKDTIPALIAMLNDPESQVRQVAHFALRNLTGRSSKLSPTASAGESTQVAEEWHDWWRKQAPGYTPVRQPPCRDW
jgi:HEAT repeat protein